MSTVRENWGLACPDCNSDEWLEIDFVGTATLTPDGTVDDGNHIWDQDSFCRCINPLGCKWEGTVMAANVEEEK